MTERYTDAQDVFDSFETSFRDKNVLSREVEKIWLLKAIARYSVELEPLNFDEVIEEFDCKLPRYTIDTLAAFMKQSYQEREVSKVNKRVSIVTPSLSVDGNNASKTAARNELEYDAAKAEAMIFNQKPCAYD